MWVFDMEGEFKRVLKAGGINSAVEEGEGEGGVSFASNVGSEAGLGGVPRAEKDSFVVYALNIKETHTSPN